MNIEGKIIDLDEKIINSLRKEIPDIDNAIIVKTDDGKIYALMNIIPTEIKDIKQSFDVLPDIEFSSEVINTLGVDSNFSRHCQNMINWINSLK